MSVNNQSRFERDLALEKLVDKLIVTKNIDTFEGSVAVMRDKEKKIPKDLSKIQFGHIKPIKGSLVCLIPDYRYELVIYDAAFSMIKPNNQKVAILYLLNQICSNEKTGEPALYQPDIKGFKAFIRKYGMDWAWKDDINDPLSAELVGTAQDEE